MKSCMSVIERCVSYISVIYQSFKQKNLIFLCGESFWRKTNMIWQELRTLHQKQVSRVGISNYIPQFLVPKSSIVPDSDSALGSLHAFPWGQGSIYRYIDRITHIGEDVRLYVLSSTPQTQSTQKCRLHHNDNQTTASNIQASIICIIELYLGEQIFQIIYFLLNKH